MKKMVTLLLAVIMVLGMAGTALAYDGAITFQGIPWGSSYEETLQILIDKGFINPEMIEYAHEMISHESGSYLKEHPEMTCETAHDHSEVLSEWYLSKGLLLAEDVKIAGYDVKALALTFVNNNGDSELIHVWIDLSFNNSQEALQDLKQKLNSVYGASVDKSMFGSMWTYCWHGNDDSVIYLYSIGNGELSYFSYGTLNAEKMIEEALQNYQAPGNGVSGSDVGGL